MALVKKHLHSVIHDPKKDAIDIVVIFKNTFKHVYAFLSGGVHVLKIKYGYTNSNE